MSGSANPTPAFGPPLACKERGYTTKRLAYVPSVPLSVSGRGQGEGSPEGLTASGDENEPITVQPLSD